MTIEDSTPSSAKLMDRTARRSSRFGQLTAVRGSLDLMNENRRHPLGLAEVD